MHPELAPERRFPAPLRRVVAQFARVVCPPEIEAAGRVEDTVRELEQMLYAMPAHLRLGLFSCFTAFDQGARLWPRARGRRFVELEPERAEAYFVAVAHGLPGPQRKVAQIMKGLTTLSYYELPRVKEALEYHPDAYIAQVAKRRLDSYAADIARVEAEVLVPLRAAPSETRR